MKQFWIILGAFILLGAAIIYFAGVEKTTVLTPSVNVVRGSNGLLVHIEHGGKQIAILLPADCDNQTSRTTTNSATGKFDVDTDFSSSDGAHKANIQYRSVSPFVLTINDNQYNLGDGRVFCVATKQDTAGVEKVVQVPFEPLEPSLEYLDKLKSQLDP